MPRPKKIRYITNQPGTTALVPGDGVNADIEPIVLGWGEYEAIRLVDYEGLYQDAAGEMLGVSRQTVGRILTEGRRKLIGALVEGRTLEIEGGDAEMMVHYICSDCANEWLMFQGTKPSKHCPACGGQNISVAQPEAGGRGRGCGRRRRWAEGPGGPGHPRGRGRMGGRGRK